VRPECNYLNRTQLHEHADHYSGTDTLIRNSIRATVPNQFLQIAGRIRKSPFRSSDNNRERNDVEMCNASDSRLTDGFQPGQQFSSNRNACSNRYLQQYIRRGNGIHRA